MLAEGFEGKADHVLVALALSRSFIALTSEKWSSSPSPFAPKIPNLCEEFHVECVDVNQFCRKEYIAI